MPACPRVPAEHVEQLPLQVRRGQHAIDEVRAVERAHELEGVPQLELRGDVAAHACRRRRGVGVHARAGQDRPQPRELTVFRSKVVPPLADAMGFVDRDEAHAARRQELQEMIAAFAHEALRRHVEQPQASVAQRGDAPAPSPPARASCCSTRPARRCRRACRPDPSSTRSAARRRARARRGRGRAPESRATCRRRSAAPRSSRGRRGSRPSHRAAADGTRYNPSSAAARRRALRRRERPGS